MILYVKVCTAILAPFVKVCVVASVVPVLVQICKAVNVKSHVAIVLKSAKIVLNVTSNVARNVIHVNVTRAKNVPSQSVTLPPSQ